MIAFFRAQAPNLVRVEVVNGDLFARLAVLQLGCPSKLSLEGLRNGGVVEEKKIRKSLESKRSFGHWYELSVEEVQTIVNQDPAPIPDPPSCEEPLDDPIKQTSMYFASSQLQRAERLVPVLKQHWLAPYVRTSISRSTVLRIAIDRGIKVLEEEFEP